MGLAGALPVLIFDQLQPPSHGLGDRQVPEIQLIVRAGQLEVPTQLEVFGDPPVGHGQPGDGAPPAMIRFGAPCGHACQEEHDPQGTARPVNGPVVHLQLGTVIRNRVPAAMTLLASALDCEAASIGQRVAVERPRCWNSKALRVRRIGARCVTDAPPVLALLERLAHLLELLTDKANGDSLIGLDESPVDSASSFQHEDTLGLRDQARGIMSVETRTNRDLTVRRGLHRVPAMTCCNRGDSGSGDRNNVVDSVASSRSNLVLPVLLIVLSSSVDRRGLGSNRGHPGISLALGLSIPSPQLSRRWWGLKRVDLPLDAFRPATSHWQNADGLNVGDVGVVFDVDVSVGGGDRPDASELIDLPQQQPLVP